MLPVVHTTRFQESPMKRLISLMLLVLFAASTMTACNTVKGVGKDVEKVGDEMQEAADETGGTNP
ncbi:hypothetical protein GCM10023332_02360 [Luteimonas vadosa]|uniref:Entericidin A/B family lipoprotein n=2 Tax=Luteimonas vadosa TaxID=1165507 RepID=A0ABP9DNY8_9GAMM